VGALAINCGIASHRGMAKTLSPRVAEQLLIGRTLRSIREGQDPRPTLREIGSRLEMSGAAYQKYETGETRIDSEKLRVILEALGTDSEYYELARARLLQGETAPMPAFDFRENTRSFEVNVFGRAHAGALGIEV